MTNNVLPLSNQANGGNMWDPYQGNGVQSNINTKPTFSTASLIMITVGLFLSFILSLFPTFYHLNRFLNPAAHHVSEGSYYLANLGSISGYLFFLLTVALFAGFSFVVGVIIDRFYKKNDKDVLDAVFKLYALLMVFLFASTLMIIPCMAIPNAQPGENYDNWIKNQINVSEVIYLKNGFIQGKNGIYKIDKEKESGYFKYSIKKVEL